MSTTNGKIISSKHIYAPQTYVELMTGNFYTGRAWSTTPCADIMKLLKANGIYGVKNYALDDIEGVIKGGKQVVLVDCLQYKNGMAIYDYRWFQTSNPIEA